MNRKEFIGTVLGALAMVAGVKSAKSKRLPARKFVPPPPPPGGWTPAEEYKEGDLIWTEEGGYLVAKRESEGAVYDPRGPIEHKCIIPEQIVCTDSEAAAFLTSSGQAIFLDYYRCETAPDGKRKEKWVFTRYPQISYESKAKKRRVNP